MVLQKPREIAAQILLAHADSQAYIEELVDRELAATRLPSLDRGLVQEICYGCIRWRQTLDWLIDRQARFRPPGPEARVFLRLGLYQLFWLDRVPPHAAVHETVEAAHALDRGPFVGFLNALLRAYTRTLEETRAELTALKTKDPALGWSHPRWLVERWRQALSAEALQKLLEWNNSPAPLYARINTLKTDAGRVIEAWRREGVDYNFTHFDWIGENLVFEWRRHPPIERLKSYADGSFYVQDPSTLLAVALLDPQPGESILDLCAAPGGKTTFIAQRLDNDGRVVASEPDPRRRRRLHENCERLAADVTVLAPDDPRAQGPFDRVLVDAPCSNTGVLRRRLDARWRLEPGEIRRCQSRQAHVIAEGLRRLRPGGRLVYSTCSLEPEENAGAIRAALGAHPGLVLESERTLHPATDRVDGAYAARLLRP